MPEGPEVRCIARSLTFDLVGQKLTGFTYDDTKINKYHRSQIVLYERLRQMLPVTITGMSAKGKKIIFILRHEDDEFYLISSLGMTGGWLWNPLKHTVFTLQLDNGKTLYYNDPRMFGSLVVALNSVQYYQAMDKVGACWLSEEISLERWIAFCQGKSAKNKQAADFLLHQEYFSGIGNYLKSDILYDARIAPHRTMGTLNDEELTRMYYSILTIINASYDAGGYTMHDYLNPYQERGNYVPLVYGRDTDADGRKVERVTLKDGRTTYWVPELCTSI